MFEHHLPGSKRNGDKTVWEMVGDCERVESFFFGLATPLNIARCNR